MPVRAPAPPVHHGPTPPSDAPAHPPNPRFPLDTPIYSWLTCPPLPPSRSKLLEVYLYLGVRDAAYLVLPDQAAALAAAAELAASKALGTEGTDHLPSLCAALGVADLAAARQMREIMRLTVGGAPSGTPSLEKAEAGADSPATITAALGAVSPAPGVAASPGPRRSVDM